MRTRERILIHKVMSCEDYDDVIFPIVKDVSDPWNEDSYTNSLVFKKEIREDFFLEIRNILNGYSNQGGEPYDEAFADTCAGIKGLVPDDGRYFGYEWLNLKEIRKIIKTWTGEPLEALKYLTDKGFIEKAVRNKTKLLAKK